MKKLPLITIALLTTLAAATLLVVASDIVTLRHSEYGIGRIAARHLLQMHW